MRRFYIDGTLDLTSTANRASGPQHSPVATIQDGSELAETVVSARRPLRLIYIVYTIYVVFVAGSTSLTVLEVSPALILMWTGYTVFSSGERTGANSRLHESRSGLGSPSPTWLLRQPGWILLLLGILAMACAVLAGQYYTGQSPVEALQGMAKGDSLYLNYQVFFQDQQRATLSAGKIPFIAMLFYIKAGLFYAYAALFLEKKTALSGSEIALVAAITLSHVYVGMVRGTNFELFELLILIVFLAVSRRRRSKLPVYALIVTLSLAMIAAFSLSVEARGVQSSEAVSRDVAYDGGGVVSVLSPATSSVVVQLFDYFGFGFFYMAHYLTEVLPASIPNLISAFVPSGYLLSSGEHLNTIMAQAVDMGPRWHPDAALYIDRLGIVGLFIACWLLGSLDRRIAATGCGTLAFVTQFLIFLQMASLPVGNFVFASSASMLVVVSVVALWLARSRQMQLGRESGVRKTASLRPSRQLAAFSSVPSDSQPRGGRQSD